MFPDTRVESAECPVHGDLIFLREGEIPVLLPRVEPEFLTEEANEPIPIVEEDGEIRQGMVNVEPLLRGRASVQLEWDTAASDRLSLYLQRYGMGRSRDRQDRPSTT
jgi:hypothetical protein